MGRGGLASHGGGLGVLIAALYHAKRHNIGTLWLLDRLAISTGIFAFFCEARKFCKLRDTWNVIKRPLGNRFPTSRQHPEASCSTIRICLLPGYILTALVNIPKNERFAL